jgi:hypothetical protein
MIDPSRRAAPDCDERQAAEQLVVGKRGGNRRFDVDTVLDQHDDGARSDRRPDQRCAVDAFEHLRGQDQVVGRFAAFRHVPIDPLRPEAMVAEHRTVDVVSIAADRVVIGATDDGNPRALTGKRRAEQCTDRAGADDENVHRVSIQRYDRRSPP